MQKAVSPSVSDNVMITCNHVDGIMENMDLLMWLIRKGDRILFKGFQAMCFHPQVALQWSRHSILKSDSELISAGCTHSSKPVFCGGGKASHGAWRIRAPSS